MPFFIIFTFIYIFFFSTFFLWFFLLFLYSFFIYSFFLYAFLRSFYVLFIYAVFLYAFYIFPPVFFFIVFYILFFYSFFKFIYYALFLFFSYELFMLPPLCDFSISFCSLSTMTIKQKIFRYEKFKRNAVFCRSLIRLTFLTPNNFVFCYKMKLRFYLYVGYPPIFFLRLKLEKQNGDIFFN